MASVGSSRFAGRLAVVTGGSRGIGAAVAARLAAEGAAVGIGYRGNQQAADELVATLGATGGRGLAMRADVADPEQTKALIERAVSEVGQLDVPASCAGIEHFDALENITTADQPTEQWVAQITALVRDRGMNGFVYWPDQDHERQLGIFAHEVVPAVRQALATP
jgi:NAD(P)-dependent dehydrogenase (short-subunit alcohol dehydrogenase family)